MKNVFNSIFKKQSEKKIVTKISREEAIRIACEHDIAKEHKDIMGMTSVEKRDGKIIWVVSSAGIGRRIHVEIDDETGKIINAKTSGLR